VWCGCCRTLSMKGLPMLLLLTILSVSAFAQFPLGSTMPKVKAYFYRNVPYSFVQEFKAENGDTAICFTKVKVLGDFTFYFDHNGVCTYYVVTYGKQEQPEVVHLLDHKYCKTESAKWISEEGKFDVILLPPTPGANYFSIVYKSDPSVSIQESTLNTLATN
jgi:hypothetical protein